MNRLVHQISRAHSENPCPDSQQNVFICNAKSQCLCTTAYSYSPRTKEKIPIRIPNQRSFFRNGLLVLQVEKARVEYEEEGAEGGEEGHQLGQQVLLPGQQLGHQGARERLFRERKITVNGRPRVIGIREGISQEVRS
jgi:hypothetical protein